jgi:NADPH:quinone reductase-like Zn-dependent oxidoreductase
LIQGTGGVALFALQFAKMSGARTIVLSSSNEKLDRVRELGADAVVNYLQVPEWHTEVLSLTQGRGADHAMELGGPGTFTKSLQAIRLGGAGKRDWLSRGQERRVQSVANPSTARDRARNTCRIALGF